LNSSVIISS